MAAPQNPFIRVTDFDEESSQGPSSGSSAPPSRSASNGIANGKRRKEKNRVRFNPGGESLDLENQKAPFEILDKSSDPTIDDMVKPLPKARILPTQIKNGPTPSSYFPPMDSNSSQDSTDSSNSSYMPRGRRPSLMRLPSEDSSVGDVDLSDLVESDDEAEEKAQSERSARERAERLSRIVNSHSDPSSRKMSVDMSPASPTLSSAFGLGAEMNNIPLKDLQKRRKYGIEDETDDDEAKPSAPKKLTDRIRTTTRNAFGLKTPKDGPNPLRVKVPMPGPASGPTTPVEDRDPNGYIPPPKEYRAGFLSSMLNLYDEKAIASSLGDISGKLRRIPRRTGSQNSMLGKPITGHSEVTPGGSTSDSGASTPRRNHPKWYYKNGQPSSTGSIKNLLNPMDFAQPGAAPAGPGERPGLAPRSKSSDALSSFFGLHKGPKLEDSIHIQVHIAETMSRQKYLLKICRALMTYGAPTHRLEEYMRMSARVLEIEGQFLYLPGCMIISFDDSSTHTTEVKIVRSVQGIDLGKLQDVHEIYKEVVHDLIGVDEAIQRIDELNARPQLYPVWVIVLVYGLASASVGPFAFGARFIDLPIAFLLGCLLGIMQLILAPKSDTYSNIFEISAAVGTSFLARAFGSIKGGEVFCFSALAQSSIALILPGYIVLCGSLELQSRNIVAGSVRMVYAIIYSLFLGFGITVGTSFYGGLDAHATSEVTCRNPPNPLLKFPFVPIFAMCLIIINQGRWRQSPIMVIIAFAGYTVNHFSAIRFVGNAQIANTLGALAVGVLGNLYSRLYHGLAAAALLPAIFVQVPSGLAASGSLVSGVTSANQITNETGSAGGGTTTVSNGTLAVTGGQAINTMVFNVGYSVIQIAIGITVGLFLSALVVYPVGKRRSGLFSF